MEDISRPSVDTCAYEAVKIFAATGRTIEEIAQFGESIQKRTSGMKYRLTDARKKHIEQASKNAEAAFNEVAKPGDYIDGDEQPPPPAPTYGRSGWSGY